MEKIYYSRLTVRLIETLFLWMNGEPDRLLEAGIVGFVSQRDFPYRPYAPEQFAQDLHSKAMVQVKFEGAQEWISVPTWSLEALISGISPYRTYTE